MVNGHMDGREKQHNIYLLNEHTFDDSISLSAHKYCVQLEFEVKTKNKLLIKFLFMLLMKMIISSRVLIKYS